GDWRRDHGSRTIRAQQRAWRASARAFAQHPRRDNDQAGTWRSPGSKVAARESKTARLEQAVSVQVAGEERSRRHGPSESRAAVLTVDFIGFWPLHGRASHSIGMETSTGDGGGLVRRRVVVEPESALL